MKYVFASPERTELYKGFKATLGVPQLQDTIARNKSFLYLGAMRGTYNKVMSITNVINTQLDYIKYSNTVYALKMGILTEQEANSKRYKLMKTFYKEA